jgi:hypothetical protein
MRWRSARQLLAVAEELSNLRTWDLLIVGHVLEQRRRREQHEGLEDRAAALVLVLEAPGHDQERGVIDLVGNAAAWDLHPHDAGATRQQDHRPIVTMKILEEPDAALVGDAHRPRQVHELIQEIPFGGDLEASPLWEGESHVTILTK